MSTIPVVAGDGGVVSTAQAAAAAAAAGGGAAVGGSGGGGGGGGVIPAAGGVTVVGGGVGGGAGVGSAEMDAQQRKELRNLIVAIKSKNSNQQLHGLTQLKILSSADAKNKVIIREEGTIGPTVLLLASENVKIQLAAVRLLRSLSVNEENQQAIADENGIPPLINLLESPFAKLQLNAAATLWNLSVNDENKRKIAKEGAIRPLIFLLDSNNIKVQNEACGALRNLSFNDKNQRLIGKDGGITLLLDLLKSDDENLKRNSAITLNNLTSSNEENKRRLRKEGGVELLISVLLANDINVLGFDPEKELQKRPRPDGFKGNATVTGNGSEDSSVSLTTEVFDTVVWNDIKIEKKIGSGAYGDVYKARYHGYPIAVKIIKESLSAEEQKREKILEEIKIMSMLKHPNIVSLVGCCLTPDHQVAIVTEFAGRGNLKDSLKDVKSLPQRLKLAKDIVAGLNWMHANNIIHRDLKLANLLVTEDFQIKITDFGLSLHWYEGIVCHHFKGNVKYSSPEILRARADKNITIYAYCVRAADHQILTNRGYMFLDDVEAHVVCDAAGRVVDWRGLQVATYDARRNALVFATPRGLVRNERSGSFIEFTAAGSAAMWSDGKSAADDKSSSRVSVVVTPDHQMYAAKGASGGQFRKLSAAQLAATNGVVRFMTTALNGGSAATLGAGRFAAPKRARVVDYAIVDSHADAAAALADASLPFGALGLATGAQLTAFLELYGFWLGGDSSLCSSSRRVVFASAGEADARFVALRLRALGLDAQTRAVAAPAYVKLFFDEYAPTSRNKWCAAWVWRLAPASLRALLRGFHLAGGVAGRNVLLTSSVRMRDELVHLCELAGFAASFGERGGAWRVLYSDDAQPALAMGSAGATDASRERLEVRPIAEDGRSWCFDMNDGFIVTRRARRVPVEQLCGGGVGGGGFAVSEASQAVILGNCPQTDVYSFGLMLWELVTVMPLFPGVKGKQNITQHVLAGNRPEIYEEWPKSLKTLLALCWHEDPNRRPLFREIQDKFDRVIIDVMCFGRDTPVLLADGRFKMVQHLAVGDVVLGDDGRTARTVTRTTRGVDHMARVQLVDGGADAGFVCNLSHLLSCKLAAAPRVTGARVALVVSDADAGAVDDGEHDNEATALELLERDAGSPLAAQSIAWALGARLPRERARDTAALVRHVDNALGLRLSDADVKAVCARTRRAGGERLAFDGAQLVAVKAAVRARLALGAEQTPMYYGETLDVAARHVLALAPAVRKALLAYRLDGRTSAFTVRRLAARDEFFGFTVGGNGRVVVGAARIVSHQCPDPTGRRICKKLWKGCELKKVSYEEFEEAFLEKTRLNLKLIRHIHLKCFDEESSQLLTSDGFMFLDQLLDRVEWHAADASRHGTTVRVTDWRGLRLASYDERAATLVYKQPTELVVNAPGGELVHIAAAAHDVDLLATRNHELYVRPADRAAAFAKLTCDALLRDAALADERADVQPTVRLLGAAANGVAGAAKLPAALADDEPERTAAFLQFYGAWLAAGAAFTSDGRATVSGDDGGDVTLVAAAWNRLLADEYAARDGGDLWLFDWVLGLGKAAARSVIFGLRGKHDDEIRAGSVRLRDELLRLCLHAGYTATFARASPTTWSVRFADDAGATEPLVRLAGAKADRLEVRATGGRTWCVDLSSTDARTGERRNDGFVVVRRAQRDAAGGGVVAASRPTIQGNCLCAVICDNFDDTITLERFCNAVNWFGPMYPVEKFLERIRDLLQKKWFHGFVNSNKAAQLLKTRWSSTKQQYYLYRFSLSTPGCFALTFIEEDGTIVHKRISHSFNSSFVLMNNSPPLDFPTIDLLHNGCVQDANLLRSKKILPGSVYSSLFE